MRRAATALACLLAATACSVLRPVPVPEPAGVPAATTPVAAGLAAGPLPHSFIGSSGPVVGVNLYALRGYTAEATRAAGERMLSYIKSTLHAGAVDIVWNMYAPGRHANLVESRASTLSAADVGILTQLAAQYHLLVEYRPMLFVANVANAWEGLITPTNPPSWFRDYFAVNLPYLRMAQRYHIAEYVVGTEMDGLAADPQWASFLADCAAVYQGTISYAAHQSRYFPPLTELPPTRLTGMDMYEPLNVPASATLAQVIAAYESFFRAVPATLLRRTAIQETGIQARAGAYALPPDLGYPGGTLDETIQYNWFTAACETVREFHLRAVFFWKVDLSDYPLTHPAASLSTFEGRSGAAAISKCASIIRGK